MSDDLFKIFITYYSFKIIYIYIYIYISEQDLALNIQQWLICNNT